MVDNVAGQEARRRDQRENHARHVALPDIPADPEPTHRDEHGADRVEGRVDRGEVVDCHKNGALNG